MNKTYYQAQILYISRGQIRGGAQWSTIKCKRALEQLGYSPRAHQQELSLVQVVKFQGTREEVLAHRRRITDRLQSLASNHMAIRFDYTIVHNQEKQND